MLYAHMRFDGPTELSEKRTPPMVDCDASREFFVDRFTYLEVTELLDSKQLRLYDSDPEDEVLFLIDLGNPDMNRGFVSYATSKLRPPGVYMSYQVADDAEDEAARSCRIRSTMPRSWHAQEMERQTVGPDSRPKRGWMLAAQNFWDELQWFNRIARESLQWPWD